MVRPRKSGLDYFPHDTGAANDPDIRLLIHKHGLEGYAIYFIILETAYREASYCIDVTDDEAYDLLAEKCKTTREKLDGVVKTAREKLLLKIYRRHDRELLSSERILKTGRAVAAERHRKRQSSYSGGYGRQNPGEIPPEPPEYPAESKGNKSKVNNSKSKIETDDLFSAIPDTIKAKLRLWQHGSNAVWTGVAMECANGTPEEWILAAIEGAEKANACNWNYLKAAIAGIKANGGPGKKEKVKPRKWYESMTWRSAGCDRCEGAGVAVKVGDEWLCHECYKSQRRGVN